MIKHIQFPAFLLLFVLALLASCDEKDEVILKNGLVAVAGADQTVTVQTETEFDGSASFDKNGKSFTYTWSVKTKPAGSVAVFSRPGESKTSFTPDKPGVYLIELSISQGSMTAKDHLIVTATSQEPNGPTTVILNQDINAPTVLADIFDDPTLPDYIVTQDLNVRADLTIAPGVVIFFNDHSGWQILQGSFRAIGTDSKPIVFEGYGDAAAYWKGLVFYSNSDDNELKHVSIREAGSMAFYETGVRTAVMLVGTLHSTAAVKISHTSIEKSGGYGLFVSGRSRLNFFESNHFVQNTYSAAYVPAQQLHMVDGNTDFSGNGFNGIETYGEVVNDSEVIWKKLNNASYLVSNYLTVESGVRLQPGTSFKMTPNTTIEIYHNGYLRSVGTAEEKIVFTSRTNTEYWNGLFFNSSSNENKLEYTEVSYAGHAKIADASYEANITVGMEGKVTIENSEIKFGLGFGLVAKASTQVNQNIIAVNSFHNLTKGLVHPQILQDPDMPSLEGEWLDEWSFNNGKTTVSVNFYDRATQSWFEGGASPWTMSAGKGMGIHIGEDKSYRWAIAEHSPWSGCESYSSEFITGTLAWTGETIVFTETAWRTRFINSCEPDQNVDMEVTPGQMTLPYAINKMYNMITGEAYWQLQFKNPDNSTFAFYRR